MAGTNLATNSIDRLLARGQAIVCFQADGCMAHDHKFQWYGVIESFHEEGQGSPVMVCVVKILKRKDNPQDIRDTDLGTEKAIAAHISILTGGAYIVFT